MRSGAGPRAACSDGCDVIVPVHGAPEDLRRCLASILRHTDLVAAHGLIVIEDAAADPAVDEQLQRLEARTDLAVEVLRNPVRRGFVGSVNAGMSRSARDVILLNSDTEVTAGWVEKLAAAAASAPEIATVTPFSNDATICSLPQPLVHNELPAGHDVDSFAALVEQVSVREYPRLPTGVGMCLYIKRGALERLGLFDEEAYGLGYGEENEFCVRASRLGFVHVLDDATFVWHAGQRSFRSSGRSLRRRATRVLRRRHPEYFPAVARFLAQDPLREARERVIAASSPPHVERRRSDRFERVVHLVHGWPPSSRGGTELYAQWLARAQSAGREVSVYARVSDPEAAMGDARELLDGGIRVRLVVNDFLQRDPLSRASLRNRLIERDFRRFLDDVRPDLLHVHHLVGHAASLLTVAARRGLPILYQAQDWWPACARVNLTHATLTLCSGPGIDKCARCFRLTRLPPAWATNRTLHLLRARWLRRQLRLPDAFVMGSRFIERTYREWRLLPPGAPVFVRPYGVPLADDERARRTSTPGARLPLVVGYVGSILPHKGVHVAVDAFRDIPAASARLEVWGDHEIDPEYTRELGRRSGDGAVVFRGSFREEEKAAVLGSFDLLVVPSIGYESFGLVAREAVAVGTPVLVARGSALAELAGDGGAGFEHGDAADLRRQVLELAEEPSRLARWAAALPPVLGFAEHAAELDAVYAELADRLAHRSGGG